jgi:hypothetical protein
MKKDVCLLYHEWMFKCISEETKQTTLKILFGFCCPTDLLHDDKKSFLFFFSFSDK